MTRKQVWKVYRREVKSNGKPFPYQQDEITYFWLTATGLWADDKTRGAVYPDYRAATRDARTYQGTAGKFTE